MHARVAREKATHLQQFSYTATIYALFSLFALFSALPSVGSRSMEINFGFSRAQHSAAPLQPRLTSIGNELDLLFAVISSRFGAAGREHQFLSDSSDGFGRINNSLESK